MPASELAAARAEIAKLQRVLGKKNLENEIFKEAVEYAAEKDGLRARMCVTCSGVMMVGLMAAATARPATMSSCWPNCARRLRSCQAMGVFAQELCQCQTGVRSSDAIQKVIGRGHGCGAVLAQFNKLRHMARALLVGHFRPSCGQPRALQFAL